jgi:hypothetical protein
MSRKLIEAQEQERSRIARELHDDIKRLTPISELFPHEPVHLGQEAAQENQNGAPFYNISAGAEFCYCELKLSVGLFYLRVRHGLINE